MSYRAEQRREARAAAKEKRRVEVSQATMGKLLHSDVGQQIAQHVDELKAWCGVVGLDFDEVSDLFDRYLEMTDKSLVEAVEHFKTILMQMGGANAFAMRQALSSPPPKLILPSDKDFGI